MPNRLNTPFAPHRPPNRGTRPWSLVNHDASASASARCASAVHVMRNAAVKAPRWRRDGRTRWTVLAALALVSIILGVGVLYGGLHGVGLGADLSRYWKPPVSNAAASGTASSSPAPPAPSAHDGVDNPAHPMEQLMTAAEKSFALQLASQPTSLASAASNYRTRRGRHPPPNFDAWHGYATSHSALIPESFFDEIYTDLAPFWGVNVYELRRTISTFRPRISVVNGTADSKVKNSYKNLEAAVDLLNELLRSDRVELPDVEMPFNVGEEVGMLVPWGDVATAVEFAGLRPGMLRAEEVVQGFTSASPAPARGKGGNEEVKMETFDPEWKDGRLRHGMSKENFGPRPLWSLVRPACPPFSPTRKEELWADIWHKEGHMKEEHSAAALLPLEEPEGSFEGYVRNWSAAGDVCEQPRLQGLHGAFVAPEEISVTQKLFPLFSASKMGVSGEILLPSSSGFNGSTTWRLMPWEEKKNRLYWRGPATGGRNSAGNWQRFHRQRFVAMLNATHVEIAEGLLHAGNESMVGLGYARNFRLLPGNAYGLETQRGGKMAAWVNGWADAAFTDLHCDSDGVWEGGMCAYTDEYFSVAETQGEGKDAGSEYKYAAVLDGNGGDDHGEFVAALRAGRVALKASVYKQWFDARVVPWVHFVPMDNTFVDLYGVVEYFVGTEVRGGTEEFAHAHVELPVHEHHFQTPHAEEDEKPEESDPREHGHGRRRDPAARRMKTVGDGHDDAARKIAEAGQTWAAKVLRKEDMFVYMYRLLLEYARVIDTRRERLGWVDDLLGTEGS
jgi:hypothetical protein